VTPIRIPHPPCRHCRAEARAHKADICADCFRERVLNAREEVGIDYIWPSMPFTFARGDF
jgi:hypothetical protein